MIFMNNAIIFEMLSKLLILITIILFLSISCHTKTEGHYCFPMKQHDMQYRIKVTSGTAQGEFHCKKVNQTYAEKCVEMRNFYTKLPCGQIDYHLHDIVVFGNSVIEIKEIGE